MQFLKKSLYIYTDYILIINFNYQFQLINREKIIKFFLFHRNKLRNDDVNENDNDNLILFSLFYVF